MCAWSNRFFFSSGPCGLLQLQRENTEAQLAAFTIL